MSLAAGGACTNVVSFTPMQAGNVSVVVANTATYAGGTAMVTATLSYGGVAPTGAVTLSQGNINGDQEIDLALTYASTHSNHTNGATLWLQGGGLTMNAQFYRGFGLMASGTGLHASASTNSAALDLVTVAFGPSYTVHAGRRLSIFGEALLGEAHGIHSVFSYGSGPLPSLTAGTTDSADTLAFQTGGGIDLRLSPHFAIRPVEVEYLRTQLPNGGTDLQNNVRFAAGLVATFRDPGHHHRH